MTEHKSFLDVINSYGSLILSIGAIVSVYVTMNTDIELLKKDLVHAKATVDAVNERMTVLDTRLIKMQDKVDSLKHEMELFVNIQSGAVIEIKDTINKKGMK